MKANVSPKQKEPKKADLTALRADCALLIERKRREIVREWVRQLREVLLLPPVSGIPSPADSALRHKNLDLLYRQFAGAIRSNDYTKLPELFVANHFEVLDHAQGLVPLLTKISLLSDLIRESIILEMGVSKLPALYYLDKLISKLTAESVVYFGKKRRIGLNKMTKRYEQEKELNQAIIESSPIGILVTDREGYITSVNSAQEEASGRPREMVLGKKLYVNYAHKAGEKLLAAFKRAIQYGETSSFKRIKYESDLGTQYLNIMLAPVLDRQGRISGCVQTMQEVTEVLALEEKMIEQNRTLGNKVTELQEAYAYIGRINRQLSSLIDLNNTLSSHTSLEKILDFIVRSASMLTKAELVTLRDLVGKNLVLRAQYGFDQKLAQNLRNVPLKGSVIGRVVTQNHPILVVDLKDEQLYSKEINKLKLQSLVSVPLRSRGKIVGVLSIHLKKNRKFSSLELNFLTALANQAALAIELEKALAPIRAQNNGSGEARVKKDTLSRPPAKNSPSASAAGRIDQRFSAKPAAAQRDLSIKR